MTSLQYKRVEGTVNIRVYSTVVTDLKLIWPEFGNLIFNKSFKNSD